MTLVQRAAAAALLAAALAGCGFHLRGEGGNYTLPFSSLYVGLPESSPLAIDLKRNIRANGHTAVARVAKDAEASIEVLTDPEKTRTKTILSLNSNGRVRQYLLSYNIVFRITDKAGNELLGPTPINLQRPIDFNETQVLAKEQEEALLYKDMQTDLVQQMMRRMAAIKPQAAAAPSTVPPVPTAPGLVPNAPPVVQ
ncbi:LPS assembly lipoprotein LptE [Pseudoduganella sp. UC29_106]|uniref:LPS-assembly lipoprotein LptE n=1 Tax=Pseudoduganella sp. UC29_106 TaxID=3374553 RepID=UPI00375849B2